MRRVILLLLCFLPLWVFAVTLSQNDQEFILRLDTPMHSGVVQDVSLCAAKNLFLTVSRDKTARLWSLQNGEALGVFRVPVGEGTKGELWAGVLSGNGAYAFVAGDTPFLDGFGVFTFALDSGELAGVIGPLNARVVSLARSPDSGWLAIGLETGELLLYSFASMHIETRINVGMGPVVSPVFSPDGSLLAAACSGAGIALMQKEETGYSLVQSQPLHSGEQPSSLCFGPGQTLLVGYLDGTWVDMYSLNPMEWMGLARVPEGSRGFFWSLQCDGAAFPVVAAGEYEDAILGKGVLVWQNSLVQSPVFVPIDKVDARFAFPLDPKRLVVVDDRPSWWVKQFPGDIQVHVPSSIPFIQENTGLRVSPDGFQVFWQNPGGSWDGFDLEQLSVLKGFSSEQLPPVNRPTLFDFSLSLTNWKGSSTAVIGHSVVDLGDGETGVSFCLDVPGKRVFIGTQHTLQLFDGGGNALWHTSVPSAVRQLVVTGEGKQCVALLQNGMVQWFRAEDGTLLVSLFSAPRGREWIAWTPRGFFAASPGAETLAGWHVNFAGQQAQFFPLSRYFDAFFQPLALIQSLVKNQVVEEVDFPPPQVEEIVHVPRIQLVHPALETQTDHGEMEAQIVLEGESQPVKLRIFWNGRLFREIQAAARSEVVVALKLLEGENHFRAVACTESGLESESIQWMITRSPSQPQTSLPTLWGIFVGVSEYQMVSRSLAFAERDAISLEKVFREGSAGIFEKVKIQVLTNEAATLSALEQAFDSIAAQAEPGDTFVFFFSGHGGVIEDPLPGYYLGLFDSFQEGLGFVPPRSFSSGKLGKWAEELPAVSFFAAIDACQSGSLLDLFYFARLGRKQGLSLLTATTGTESAYEEVSLQAGVLTYSLLQGLQGEADTKDGKVDTAEISDFSVELLESLLLKGEIHHQVPRNLQYGSTFVLTQTAP